MIRLTPLKNIIPVRGFSRNMETEIIPVFFDIDKGRTSPDVRPFICSFLNVNVHKAISYE